jgi:hypothetical protein
VSGEPHEEEILEGSIADSSWRYRTTDTPGQIVFQREEDGEQSLELTGGAILEVRDLRTGGREVLARTERYEHTLHLDARNETWRILVTTGDLPTPP